MNMVIWLSVETCVHKALYGAVMYVIYNAMLMQQLACMLIV